MYFRSFSFVCNQPFSKKTTILQKINILGGH